MKEQIVALKEEAQRRMDSIDGKVDVVGRQVAELRGIVKNGLSSRVRAIDARLWAIAGGVVLELIAIIIVLWQSGGS